MTLEKGNLVVKVQDAGDPAVPAAYEVVEVSPLVFLSDPARTASPEPHVVALLRRADLPMAAPVEEPSPTAADVPVDAPLAPPEGQQLTYLPGTTGPGGADEVPPPNPQPEAVPTPA